MNKKFIALAVAAAVVAPAAFAADNEVVLYGQMNVAVQFGKTDVNAGADQRDQTAVNSMASRLGFKGQEDLGGGMAAFFQIETEIAPDNAKVTANYKGSSFASREGWVGIKGDFGSIKLGRGKSLYTQTTEELDPWFQDQSLGLTANDPGFLYRSDNTVRYDYAAGPVSFGISNSFGENKTADKNASNDFAVNAKYATDDFSVFGAYDTYRVSATPSVNTYKRLVIGGNVIVGDLSVGAAVQSRDNGTKYTDPMLLVGYTIGNLNLQLGAIAWDKDTAPNTKTQANFGGYYNLSKRTVALVEYSNSYAGVNGNNVFSLGLSHSF